MEISHILKTIELIRDSFDGSETVYRNGSCIRFAMILKHLYPSGTILYNCDHAIFEYNGETFDISGFAKKTNHIDIKEYGPEKIKELINLIYSEN